MDRRSGARKSARKAALRRRAERKPSPEELNKLALLFTQGHYAEMETLARTMTARCPLHGIAWKALGVIYQRQGKDAEAQALMQKAAKLLPHDAEVHGNLGTIFYGQGRLTEAEASYRRALEFKPDSAELRNNLGNALKAQGRLTEAEASYRRALEIEPNYVEAHSNLGAALHELGRLTEAEASCRRALEIKPEHAEAHCNLGATLMGQDRFTEAEASYRRALEIRPDFAKAYMNLGTALSELGNLDQAVAAYENAIRCKPRMAEAHKALGDAFSFLDRADDELTAYQKALTIDPGNIGLETAVALAIRYYLQGNSEQCRRMLILAQPIMSRTDAKFRGSRVYWHYLDRLLSSCGQSERKNPAPNGIETLHVIGDSHCLSAHGTVVRYHEREMHCTAQWIVGCKQWHLGNGKRNKYKHKFESVMERLSRQSTILLSIGEIDCRPDEGIIRAWKKTPDKTPAEVARATAESYVRYVAGIGARYGHRLVVGGVPATHIPLDTLTADSAGQLVRLIRTFNAILKDTALAAGMDFLDVHALTDRGDGIASGQWHIDYFHLLPSAMAEAFGKHCMHTPADAVFHGP